METRLNKDLGSVKTSVIGIPLVLHLLFYLSSVFVTAISEKVLKYMRANNRKLSSNK